ncbi:MAG: hypothetical protein HFJ41_03850 [Clostridia bacterium]|nr:hypothetical protein [Clostridia bacterium]
MLKIKDDVDLNILIKEYGFKPEYDKDTGKLIELYRINGYYLGERERRRKSATITKDENWNYDKLHRDFKEFWFIKPFTRELKAYKTHANCRVLTLDIDDYEILYDLIKADLVEKVNT